MVSKFNVHTATTTKMTMLKIEVHLHLPLFRNIIQEPNESYMHIYNMREHRVFYLFSFWYWWESSGWLPTALLCSREAKSNNIIWTTTKRKEKKRFLFSLHRYYSSFWWMCTALRTTIDPYFHSHWHAIFLRFCESSRVHVLHIKYHRQWWHSQSANTG